MPMSIIASVLLTLPYLPSDIRWREGRVVAVVWPQAAFDADPTPYINAADSINAFPAFEA